MGEILRGILDAHSVYSAPVFYDVALTNLGPLGFTPPSAFYVGTATIRSTTKFLMTSIVLRDDSNQITPMPLTFRRQNTTNQYIDKGPITDDLTEILTVQMNDSLGNCFTLPEYVLWQGDELVHVTTIGRRAIVPGFPIFHAVLIGIEYKF